MNESKSQPEAKAVSQTQPEAKAKTPSDLTPQIAKRAYEIHEERGQQSNPAVQDWEQAEKEIQKNDAKAAPKPEAKAEPKPENKTAPSSPKKKNALFAGVIVLALLGTLAIGFGLGHLWGN